jgi:hypothetical protein
MISENVIDCIKALALIVVEILLFFSLKNKRLQRPDSYREAGIATNY